VTIDEVERAEMAHLILREKDAQDKATAAREALALWVKRGKLAVKAGETALAGEAKKQALEARSELLAAEQELELVQAAKRRLRREARRPDDQSTTNAELLVENFRMQGFAPEEQELEDIAARGEAQMTIDALRAPAAPAAASAPAPAAPAPAAPAPAAPDVPAAPAGPTETSPAARPARSEPDANALAAIEAELAALRASVGAAGPVDAEALAELERALADDYKKGR
jgi:hypothetical protein